MLVAETALLIAVRNTIRTGLTLRNSQCDVELDDMLPAVAEETYYAIVAAGTRPANNHRSSGGVFDFAISVRVVLFHRMGHVARDRRRDTFLDLLTGMNADLDAVTRLLDNSYAVTAAAKVLLNATTATAGTYQEPFRVYTPDMNFKTVYREPYDAAQMTGGDPIVGLQRGITFSDCRFCSLRA